MSYKTKFRELDVFQVDDTKSLMEQIDSIGHDANSARSLGAAFYRNMQRYPHRFSRAGIRTVVQMSLPNVVRKMIDEMRKEKNLTPDQLHQAYVANMRYNRFLLEGMQKAARKDGNQRNVSYISRRLSGLIY